jgi:DUF971 family protein
VDLDRAANVLEITWEDGVRSHLGGALVRWSCPCAECRGEGGSTGRLDTLTELAEDEQHMTDVALVGQYALQIGFASGHATGIYTFRYLRGLQPDKASDPGSERL